MGLWWQGCQLPTADRFTDITLRTYVSICLKRLGSADGSIFEQIPAKPVKAGYHSFGADGSRPVGIPTQNRQRSLPSAAVVKDEPTKPAPPNPMLHRAGVAPYGVDALVACEARCEGRRSSNA